MSAGWALVPLVFAACHNNGDLIMTDANNFIYEPTIVLGDIELQSGANVTVDWLDLTTDIRQRPLDPATVQRVYAIEFIGFSKEELTAKIEKNELLQSDSGEQYLWDNSTGATSAAFENFEILGNAFDYASSFVPLDGHVWLLSLVNIVNGTNDVLQSKFLTPLDAATGLTATLTNDCSTLDVVVDLTSPAPIPVDEGAKTYRADWSAVTQDVNGHEFDPILATQLQIARYDVASAADVEDIFLRLDTEAAEFYRLDVLGHTGADDLSKAVDASTGQTFGGFTKEGVWIVALGCPTCLSPAPLYLAVVDVQ